MIIKVDRIPQPGETILGGTFIQAAGGKGANQAVAAARFGGHVTLIASVGDDTLGEESKKGFLEDGILIEHVIESENTPSGVALIFVEESGENSIAVASGANAMLSPEMVTEKREVIENADVLLMQLETPLESIEAAAKIASKNGVLTILNPAPAQKLSTAVLQNIDVLTPNETETELLTGIEIKIEADADRAAKALIEMGVGTVIITLGAKGAFVKSDNYQKMIPGFQVEPADTTAAGDTFNGVLAVELSNGKELEHAVRSAHAAAALSVTKMGAQPSIPNKEDVEAFLKNKNLNG